MLWAKGIRYVLLLFLVMGTSQAQFISPSVTNMNFVPNFSTLTPPPLNLNINQNFVLKNYVNSSNISQIDLSQPLFQTSNLNNFKKFIILPNGLVLNLNTERIKEIVDRRNLEKLKYSIYKDSLNLPNMQFLDTQMKIFPDRVQVIMPTKVKFTQIEQLENVVKYFPEIKFTIGPDQFEKFAKDIIAKRCENSSQGICANLSDEKVEQVIEKLNDPNIAKTITITEKIEYSLLPQVYYGLTGLKATLKNSLLLDSPQNKFLFKKQFINQRNNTKKSIQMTNLLVNPDLKLKLPQVMNEDNASEWCKSVYSGFDNAIAKCIVQARERLERWKFTGEDILVFWFTIGQQWSYTLQDSWSIDYVGEIYNFAIQFLAGYGVGLRLPVKVGYEMDKIKEGADKNVDITIKVSGVNLSGDDYKKLGIPQNLVFSGKEFVLQADNYLVFKSLRILGEELLDEEIDINLIPLYKWLLEEMGVNVNKVLKEDKINISKDFKTPVGRKTSDEYWDFEGLYDNDYWALPTWWERVVLYNTGIVEGEIFPKAASKIVSLPSRIAEAGKYIKLLAELGADVGLAGTKVWLTLNLHNLSKNGVHEVEYKIDQGDTDFDIDLYVVPWANDKKENYLGDYYQYWAFISWWTYEPALVLTLWGKLKIKIHTKWKDKTYSSPKLDLFSLVFTLSSDTDIPELNLYQWQFRLHPGTAKSINFKNAGKYYPIKQFIAQPALCACIQMGKNVMCGDMLLNEFTSLEKSLGSKNIYECPETFAKDTQSDDQENSRLRWKIDDSDAWEDSSQSSTGLVLPKFKWVGSIDLTMEGKKIRVWTGLMDIWAIWSSQTGSVVDNWISIQDNEKSEEQSWYEARWDSTKENNGASFTVKQLQEAKLILGADITKQVDRILQRRLYDKIKTKPTYQQIEILNKINKKIKRLMPKYKRSAKKKALLDYLYYSFELRIQQLQGN